MDKNDNIIFYSNNSNNSNNPPTMPFLHALNQNMAGGQISAMNIGNSRDAELNQTT